LNIPENLKYTKDHEWVKLDGDTVLIGITDFAQGELGDIIFVEFPSIGQTLKKDDPFGTIEAVKTVADLFAPISGEVLEINDELEDTPETINTDPYENGWLVKISISDKSEIDSLMSLDEYKEMIG